MCYESDDIFKSVVGKMVVADCDNDGMNEVIYSEPTGRLGPPKYADRPKMFRQNVSRLVVLENRKRGGYDFHRAWESPEEYIGNIAIAVGDIDGK